MIFSEGYLIKNCEIDSDDSSITIIEITTAIITGILSVIATAVITESEKYKINSYYLNYCCSHGVGY